MIGLMKLPLRHVDIEALKSAGMFVDLIDGAVYSVGSGSLLTLISWLRPGPLESELDRDGDLLRIHWGPRLSKSYP